MNYREILDHLIHRRNLSDDEMNTLMTAIMNGELTSAQISAVLIALRMKGETVDEIAAAARVMRRHSVMVECGDDHAVDTCGTGGDGAGTFNISTAAAFIAAGAGVTVAKHGNRSVSSRCGSADVLQQLGVNLDASPQTIGRCITAVGIGFLFAPKLHPAMKHAIGPRREIGVRSIFNMLGPLTNPARAKRHVLGVYAPELTDLFVHVLKNLGAEKCLIVHGQGKLDEISVSGKTRVSELHRGAIRTYDFDPLPYIKEYYSPDDICGGDPERNAEIIRSVLENEPGACTDIAVINAAAAIYASADEIEFSEAEGRARESVSSGKALAKLNELVEYTNQQVS